MSSRVVCKAAKNFCFLLAILVVCPKSRLGGKKLCQIRAKCARARLTTGGYGIKLNIIILYVRSACRLWIISKSKANGKRSGKKPAFTNSTAREWTKKTSASRCSRTRRVRNFTRDTGTTTVLPTRLPDSNVCKATKCFSPWALTHSVCLPKPTR